MTDIGAVATRLVSIAPDGCSPPAGAVIGVDHDGVRRYGVAGVRDLDSGAPMTMATSHDVASVTKVVATTTALMRLVSDRHVDIDATVRSYLPTFTGGGKDTVTVRDLLTHCGGLWEWQPLYIPAASAAEADKLVDTLPLRYPPRRERHYSDLGFMLLGRVVGLATGAPLTDAVADLVTGPLGLSSTQFARPATDDVAQSALGDDVEIAMVDSSEPYPTPYRSATFDRWRHRPIIGEVSDGNAFHAYGGVSGHAGLFSTVDDLLTWGAALAGGDDQNDLWRDDVAGEFFTAGPDAGQALGFRRYSVELDGDTLEVIGHTGYVGCAAGFIPSRNVAIAMATNRLVTKADPVPNETLWQAVLDAALATVRGAR